MNTFVSEITCNNVVAGRSVDCVDEVGVSSSRGDSQRVEKRGSSVQGRYSSDFHASLIEERPRVVTGHLSTERKADEVDILSLYR